MQNKNFLFERSDLNQATPTLLFKKWDFGQVEYPNSSRNLLSQFNLSRKPFDENSSDSYYTPPMEKKPAVTPKAPIKYKKQPKKGDLRPKKLQYTEDELDVHSIVDSGIHAQSNISNDTLFCKQHTTKCNRFDSSQKQIRRLRTKLDKIRVESNDKENDINVVENRFTNVSNNKSYVAQESSVVFNSNAEVLSQCDSNLSWKDILHWLQKRRDIGLWVQCCRKECKKWRYVEEYHDPVDVPKIWYCEMNSGLMCLTLLFDFIDKLIASCDIPEQPYTDAIKKDLIENAYNAGSIVWAHINGFPWWPAIVDDCPETFRYYHLPRNSNKPIKYHVTFFNEEKLEHSWIHKNNLKPFVANKYSEIVKRTKLRGIEYKQSLQRAHELATNALQLSITNRLKNFSYVALYEKFYDINNNTCRSLSNIAETDILLQMDTNSDDEIPCSGTIDTQFTLKKYYLEVICKNQNPR
ncbi:Zinc finger CW-type PWWP domain protein 1, partial [Anthophora quadrimaculata]